MGLDGQLHEIKNQLRLRGGYPYDPEKLSRFLQRAIEGRFEEITAPPVSRPQIPDLIKTGKTFADWLTAREILHEFLTGEKVVLREMFSISDELLARTDIMPVFRPAGATNRMAMQWRVKCGEVAPYEEVDVMEYTNSEGPKSPELYYISRSVTPDADALGDNAMSPDGLVETQKLWTNLYGWSDADLLHSMITRVHLDSGPTWTCFPDDRLPGDKGVALALWYVGHARAKFRWRYRDDRYSRIGARLATQLSLKT